MSILEFVPTTPKVVVARNELKHKRDLIQARLMEIDFEILELGDLRAIRELQDERKDLVWELERTEGEWMRLWARGMP